MTFVVTLVALLIERFFDWSHIRQWNWYLQWQKHISERLAGQNPNLILAVAIVPLAIVVGLISYILHGILYGLIGLIFDLIVLLYCLGPQNLWAEIFTQSRAEPSNRSLINHIFTAANCRVFAAIFWYLLVGVVGVIVYRTLVVSAQDSKDTPASIAHAANRLASILDWLPVRFFTFLFALGGHFTKVFTCWRKRFPSGISGNEIMLTDCGFAALGVDDQATFVVSDATLIKGAVSLIDRTLVILLVIVAIAILLSY